MTHKSKIIVLSSIIAALALAYISGIVFEHERVGRRSALFTWLDARHESSIARITIDNTVNGFESITLVQQGGNWFVSRNDKEFPARNLRVEDLIGILTRRSNFPVISTNASSHERLGLAGNTSARITVADGTGRSLLDLLIGQQDITGRNVFLRRLDQNEVRSGDDFFSTFVTTTPVSWYNLRLFPEIETGGVNEMSVQRLTVYPPVTDEEEFQHLIFTRRGREWDFNFDLTNPDIGRVNSYIRDILNTSGNNFAEDKEPTDPDLYNSRIALEFGDGSIRILRFGPEENGIHFAAVTGSPFVYSVPEWSVTRLFPNISTFERN